MLFNEDHLRSHMECVQCALSFRMRKQTDYWLSTLKQRYKYSRLYTGYFIIHRDCDCIFINCDYSANNIKIFVNCAHFLQFRAHTMAERHEKRLRIGLEFRWKSCVSYYIAISWLFALLLVCSCAIHIQCPVSFIKVIATFIFDTSRAAFHTVKHCCGSFFRVQLAMEFTSHDLVSG